MKLSKKDEKMQNETKTQGECAPWKRCLQVLGLMVMVPLCGSWLYEPSPVMSEISFISWLAFFIGGSVGVALTKNKRKPETVNWDWSRSDGTSPSKLRCAGESASRKGNSRLQGKGIEALKNVIFFVVCGVIFSLFSSIICSKFLPWQVWRAVYNLIRMLSFFIGGILGVVVKLKRKSAMLPEGVKKGFVFVTGGIFFCIFWNYVLNRFFQEEVRGGIPSFCWLVFFIGGGIIDVVVMRWITGIFKNDTSLSQNRQAEAGSPQSAEQDEDGSSASSEVVSEGLLLEVLSDGKQSVEDGDQPLLAQMHCGRNKGKYVEGIRKTVVFAICGLAGMFCWGVCVPFLCERGMFMTHPYSGYRVPCTGPWGTITPWMFVVVVALFLAFSLVNGKAADRVRGMIMSFAKICRFGCAVMAVIGLCFVGFWWWWRQGSCPTIKEAMDFGFVNPLLTILVALGLFYAFAGAVCFARVCLRKAKSCSSRIGMGSVGLLLGCAICFVLCALSCKGLFFLRMAVHSGRHNLEVEHVKDETKITGRHVEHRCFDDEHRGFVEVRFNMVDAICPRCGEKFDWIEDTEEVGRGDFWRRIGGESWDDDGADNEVGQCLYGPDGEFAR